VAAGRDRQLQIMLVCKDLNWVHIPKTGGWWVISALQMRGQNPDLTRPHKSLSDLPVEIQNRPSYFVVRNPFDWYESFWSYLCERKKIRHVWTGANAESEETLTEDQRFYWSVGDMTFRECVYEMSRYRSFSGWVDRVAYRSSGERATPVRFDNLRMSVAKILRPKNPMSARRFVKWCKSSEKVNTSSHDGVCWDSGMVAHVMSVDSRIVKEFGFVPPQ
jgi:hypothetical protein